MRQLGEADGLATVVTQLTKEELQALRGDLAAKELAEEELRLLVKKAGERLVQLQHDAKRAKALAIGLKVIGLLCAALIMVGVAPSLHTYLALAIVLASGADLALGVHGRLLATTKLKHDTERLLEFLETLNMEVVKTLRAAGSDAVTAIRGYVDALQAIVVAAKVNSAAAQEAFRAWEERYVGSLKPEAAPALPTPPP